MRNLRRRHQRLLAPPTPSLPTISESRKIVAPIQRPGTNLLRHRLRMRTARTDNYRSPNWFERSFLHGGSPSITMRSGFVPTTTRTLGDTTARTSQAQFGARAVYEKRRPPGVATALASIAIRCENRQCDFAISNVVVDPFVDEIFAGLIHLHRLDRSIFPQFANNIVALYICVRIRGVGDLE